MGLAKGKQQLTRAGTRTTSDFGTSGRPHTWGEGLHRVLTGSGLGGGVFPGETANPGTVEDLDREVFQEGRL